MPGDYAEKAMVWNDKSTHALTYLVLALWFLGLYPRSRHLRILGLLFGLGVTIEFLQASMPLGRQGDVADVIANSTGILVGFVLVRFGLDGWAQWLEARLHKLLGA
jgi:VanZ family protein